MLSEHSLERLHFLNRRGDKNADLIGKESLWIYIVSKGIVGQREQKHLLKRLTYLLDEMGDTVNGEVSVSYINHFNVQNMRQTIKLTSLFRNLVPSLLCICILSIQFFSKYPKHLWFTKIKETPLFRSTEYNIYSGNDSLESVKKRFLSEGESMMLEQ
jgi:hypothetical protein